jgi:thermostable 8-oxoguanine DNA glycosylase
MKKFKLDLNVTYSYKELYFFIRELNATTYYKGSLAKFDNIVDKFTYVPKEVLDQILSEKKYQYLLDNKISNPNFSYF